MRSSSDQLGDLLARLVIGLLVFIAWVIAVVVVRLVILAAPYVYTAVLAITERLVRSLDAPTAALLRRARSFLASRGGVIFLGALAWLLLGLLAGAVALALLLAGAFGAFGATPSLAAAREALVQGAAIGGLLALGGAVLGALAGAELANRLDFFPYTEGFYVLDDSRYGS